MIVRLAYGRGTLDVELPREAATVITPSHRPGLADERAAVFCALDAPVGTAALRARVTAWLNKVSA